MNRLLKNAFSILEQNQNTVFTFLFSLSMKLLRISFNETIEEKKEIISPLSLFTQPF